MGVGCGRVLGRCREFLQVVYIVGEGHCIQIWHDP